MKKVLIILCLLILSCKLYEYVTFDDLEIDPNFRSMNAISIYVDIEIKETELNDCWKFPWITWKEKTGSIRDKCILWLYFLFESGYNKGTLYYKYHPNKGYFWCAYSYLDNYSYNDIEGSIINSTYNYNWALQTASLNQCE